MKPFLILVTLFLTQAAAASTWLEEGTVLPMTPELLQMFNSAEKCDGDGQHEGVVAVYKHFAEDTGITMFVVYDDGSLEALKNMYGEATARDYCW